MENKNKLYRILFNIPELISGTLICIVVFINAVNVILRYVFSSPIKGVEEISLIAYVWFVMLGAASIIKRDENIKVDFLYEIWPPKVIKGFKISIVIIKFVIYILLMWLAYRVGQVSLNKTPVYHVPNKYIYYSVIVSGVFILWYLVLRIKNIVHNKTTDLAWSPERVAELQLLENTMLGYSSKVEAETTNQEGGEI